MPCEQNFAQFSRLSCSSFNFRSRLCAFQSLSFSFEFLIDAKADTFSIVLKAEILFFCQFHYFHQFYRSRSKTKQKLTGQLSTCQNIDRDDTNVDIPSNNFNYLNAREQRFAQRAKAVKIDAFVICVVSGIRRSLKEN